MGLSIAISNALSGMNTIQKGLEVLSRNVANSDTPGYHRQSVSIADSSSSGSSSARASDVIRAFNSSLQLRFNSSVSDLGFANVRSEFMSRVEQVLGKPGDATSLEKVYQVFENSLQALSTSPNDYATRALVVSSAQSLAETLNRTTQEVQGLRQETESQIGSNVTDLNRMLFSLNEINNNLQDSGTDETSRASMLDERDRLIGHVSEILDIRVSYRADDSVALMTRSGFGLLDNGATVFDFASAGSLDAGARFSMEDAENGVGTLTALTPSGLQIDAIEQGLVQSGRLGALIELRDTTLVDLQAQIDEVAAGLALSLSSVETNGTAVTGPPDGFSIDVANVQAGNDFTVSYSVNGTDHNVRVVRVDDPAKLPMDTTAPNGDRVIGLDFSGGIGAVASALDTALGSAISVTNPSGTTLQIVDDGVAGTSDINSLASHTTVTANQGAGLAFSLFVDSGNASFTNSLDGDGQKVGFAGRITINSEVITDNTLLVRYDASASLGESDRPDYLLSQLENMFFISDETSSPETGSYRLSGSAQDMIGQMLNYQGGIISNAYSQEETKESFFEAITQRKNDEYGVNVDEEMARLMELQNAYAASARILSMVQELLNELMRI